jgi:Lrp/AsnC family leucine-responsive transcriptional regulator
MFMDSLDHTILGTLMQKGRITWADLAQKVGLSAPGLMDRIRRLEEKKIIQGYRAIVDPVALGINLTAFVSVSLDRPSHRSNFLKRVKHLVEVQECHQVTGDDDFLLKIKCQHTRHLDQVLSVGIKALPGVVRTRTTVVLGTEKEGSELPLPDSFPEGSV